MQLLQFILHIYAWGILQLLLNAKKYCLTICIEFEFFTLSSRKAGWFTWFTQKKYPQFKMEAFLKNLFICIFSECNKKVSYKARPGKGVIVYCPQTVKHSICTMQVGTYMLFCIVLFDKGETDCLLLRVEASPPYNISPPLEVQSPQKQTDLSTNIMQILWGGSIPLSSGFSVDVAGYCQINSLFSSPPHMETTFEKKTCCLYQENLKPDDFGRYFYRDI